MKSLQDSGALRLNKREFEQLLKDIEKHGKGIELNEVISKVYTVRACLEIAHEYDLDLSNPTAIHHWIMDQIYLMKNSPIPTQLKSKEGE